jgi:DNA-binding MarR family transcriptional regulator
MLKRPTIDASPCNAGAMRKASRRLTQFYDDTLAPAGLRSTQYTILAELELRFKEPPTMRELARALVMDRSALGHNLRPLERDEFIVLQPSKDDRRRRHVAVTHSGRAKFKEAERLWQSAQDRFHDVFGEAKAEKLRSVLLAIAGNDRLKSPKG